MFGISTDHAGLYLTVIYLTAAFVTPFFGIGIDKFGNLLKNHSMDFK